MNLERCNSIFELFAAFNFTYAILSKSGSSQAENSFVNIIDESLLKPFSSYISDQREEYATKIARIQNNIITYYSNRNDPADISEYNRLKNIADYCATKLYVIVVGAEQQKSTARDKINVIFPIVSLILAFYCLSILVLATTEFPCKHVTLLLVVLLVCSMIWKYFRVPIFSSEVVNVSYLRIVLTFAVGLLLIVSLHIILKVCIYKGIDHQFIRIVRGLDNHIIFRPSVIIFSMVVPALHFIVYSIVFAFALGKINDDNRKKMESVSVVIDDLLEECEKLNDKAVIVPGSL